MLIGGRGSSKTTAVAEDITGHIWQNAGAKAIVARQTEASQADSSIDTFWKYFEKLGPLYSAAGGVGLFKAWNNGRTFRIPSELAVKRYQEECAKMTSRAEIAHWIFTKGDKLCGRIEFRGLPDADKGKFRGMECSHFTIVEADQVAQKQFNLCLACLRWAGTDPTTCDDKGYIKDRCVILDTNPPGTKHWIAEFEKEEAAKPKENQTAEFWHIPTDENAHNLPDNYIEETIMVPYRKNPAMIKRMRYGQYADAFDGAAVFYNYDQVLNVGYDLPWTKGAYLVRGWDFGTFNMVVWLAYWKEREHEYIHAMAEQYLEGSDTDRQASNAVKLTEAEFPFWNNRTICSGVLDFCDPAGANSNFGLSHNSKGQKVGSCVEILRTYNIFPGTLLWNRSVAVGTTLINRFLEKRDDKGGACFVIDAKNCPTLHACFSGGYRFPAPGEPGYGKDEPLKGIHNGEMDYSHAADPLRYAGMNVLKLLKGEYEAARKPNFRQPARNINAARRV